MVTVGSDRSIIRGRVHGHDLANRVKIGLIKALSLQDTIDELGDGVGVGGSPIGIKDNAVHDQSRGCGGIKDDDRIGGFLGLGEVRFPGSGDIDLTGKESLGGIIRGIEHNQVIEDLLLVGGAEVGFLDKPGNQGFGLGERGYSDAGICSDEQ